MSQTHLSMDALLSLREPGVEPGTATAREHLDHCPVCQAELDRLHQRVARLKALQPLRPGRDRWPETNARFRAERRRRTTRMAGCSALNRASCRFNTCASAPSELPGKVTMMGPWSVCPAQLHTSAGASRRNNRWTRRGVALTRLRKRTSWDEHAGRQLRGGILL